MVLDYFKLFSKQYREKYKDILYSYIIEDQYFASVTISKLPSCTLKEEELQKVISFYLSDLKTFLDNQDIHTILIFDSIFIDEDYMLGIGNGEHIIELLKAVPQEYSRGFWIWKDPFLSDLLVLKPDYKNKTITFYFGYGHLASSKITTCEAAKEIQNFFETLHIIITKLVSALEEIKTDIVTRNTDIFTTENNKHYLLNKQIRFSSGIIFQEGNWIGKFNEFESAHLKGLTESNKKEFLHHMNDVLSSYRLQKKIYAIFFKFDPYAFVNKEKELHFQGENLLVSWQISNQTSSLFLYENGRAVVFSSTGTFEEMERDLHKQVSNYAREKSLSALFQEKKRTHIQKLSSYLGQRSDPFISNLSLLKKIGCEEQLEEAMKTFFQEKFENCPTIYETTLEKIEMGDFLFYVEGGIFHFEKKKN